MSALIQTSSHSPRRQKSIAIRHFSGHVAHSERLTTPLKVAHLTDLHVGRVTPMWVQDLAVERTNAERPDIVVITGDFVGHSQLFLEDLTSFLARIEAPTFAVLGNHDHWAGATDVRRALIKANVCVLDNANTSITIARERIQLVGLDDAYTGHADHVRAVKGLNRLLPTLGLSHIAEEADALWHHGVPLVLSGHTHAGQITVAKLHELAIGRISGHRYVHGLYGDRRAAGAVYVGAGIGASVMPLRVGDRGRREITTFALGSAPGSFVEHHQEQPPLAGRPVTPEVAARRKLAVAKKVARRSREKRDDRA